MFSLIKMNLNRGGLERVSSSAEGKEGCRDEVNEETRAVCQSPLEIGQNLERERVPVENTSCWLACTGRKHILCFVLLG